MTLRCVRACVCLRSEKSIRFLVPFTLRMLHASVRCFVSHNLTQFSRTVQHEKKYIYKKRRMSWTLQDVLFGWCFSHFRSLFDSIVVWDGDGDTDSVNLNRTNAIKPNKSALLTIPLLFARHQNSHTFIFILVVDEPRRQMQTSHDLRRVTTVSHEA